MSTGLAHEYHLAYFHETPDRGKDSQKQLENFHASSAGSSGRDERSLVSAGQSAAGAFAILRMRSDACCATRVAWVSVSSMDSSARAICSISAVTFNCRIRIRICSET